MKNATFFDAQPGWDAVPMFETRYTRDDFGMPLAADWATSALPSSFVPLLGSNPDLTMSLKGCSAGCTVTSVTGEALSGAPVGAVLPSPSRTQCTCYIWLSHANTGIVVRSSINMAPAAKDETSYATLLWVLCIIGSLLAIAVIALVIKARLLAVQKRRDAAAAAQARYALLERSSQAKRVFLRYCLHELRVPLSSVTLGLDVRAQPHWVSALSAFVFTRVVLLPVQTLVADHLGGLDDDILELVEIMRTSSTAMMRVLNDALWFVVALFALRGLAFFPLNTHSSSGFLQHAKDRRWALHVGHQPVPGS